VTENRTSSFFTHVIGDSISMAMYLLSAFLCLWHVTVGESNAQHNDACVPLPDDTEQSSCAVSDVVNGPPSKGSVAMQVSVMRKKLKTDADIATQACTDTVAEWRDDMGNTCAQFGALTAFGNQCQKYGDQDFGQGTAKEVCCSCGGGDRAAQEGCANVKKPQWCGLFGCSWNYRASVCQNACEDNDKAWVDDMGNNCAEFAALTTYAENQCETYGNQNFGRGTANEMCCACGGGGVVQTMLLAKGNNDLKQEEDPNGVDPNMKMPTGFPKEANPTLVEAEARQLNSDTQEDMEDETDTNVVEDETESAQSNICQNVGSRFPHQELLNTKKKGVCSRECRERHPEYNDHPTKKARCKNSRTCCWH